MLKSNKFTTDEESKEVKIMRQFTEINNYNNYFVMIIDDFGH